MLLPISKLSSIFSVTLFASGDSRTTARLVPTIERAVVKITSSST